MHEESLDRRRKEYLDFVRSKILIAERTGFDIDPEALHASTFPHQRDGIVWALAGGRRALFYQFGLGKGGMQLQMAAATVREKGGRALIICPLGVKPEFEEEADRLGITVEYVRTTDEALASRATVLLTNYERVRDGGIDPAILTFVSLDEASILRGYGTKTFQTFRQIMRAVPYRFVATATPSPNEYKELIHYADFLGVMDSGEALTRFFQRDSERAGHLTLYPHKEKEFFIWLSSWALFVTRPSDLGYSDDGYTLPGLRLHTHVVTAQDLEAKVEKDGQLTMIRDASISLPDAAREKRESIEARVEKAKEIIAAGDAGAHWIVWHHLESERHALEKAIPGIVTIHGSMNSSTATLEKREARVRDFSQGKTRLFGTKPSLSGSGCNFQRHCHSNIFLGIDYSFNDFIQAIHRTYRFLQTETVDVHIIYADTESRVYSTLLDKWAEHLKLLDEMSALIRRSGLASPNTDALKRSIVLDRDEVKSERFTAVCRDCVLELHEMEDDSVDLIHTSIPFGNQYEYTPTYNDFGHNPTNEAFFDQMAHLIPELLRVLRPGRIAAVHVKDRIRFGNVTGYGFPTVDRFSDRTADAFERFGFYSVGRITVTTDVVRENNQTYRLGWSECCKDGSKMGVGMNEYVMLFRKMPSDTSKSYADVPVTKKKADYSRARWQLDASGYWRSSGNRLLDPNELVGFGIETAMRVYREHSLEAVYDYWTHVRFCEAFDARSPLPAKYAAFPVQSTDPENVWTDIQRMRTLNTAQSLEGAEEHVCPLQLDLIERIIERYTNPGEIVLDPFAGLMSVPYQAVKMGRYGIGIELNPGYFADGVGYLRKAEAELSAPTLFDVLGYMAPVIGAEEAA